MEIGDWKSVAGMADTYKTARELGLETNIAELEAFGFTVIPPEKNGAPKDFAARLYEKVLKIASSEDELSVELNKHSDAEKPAYGRQIFHLLERDPMFIDALMNPVVRTMGSYLMGQSYRLFSMVAFYKDGPARPTAMHCDCVGVPTPLPAYSTLCNVSWILTPYREETGTLGMVPGSHRLCRHPTQFEQPQFAGGQLDNAVVAPVIAEPGSLVVFPGNTWHCTYPKTSDGVRTHIVTAFGRNFVAAGEDYSDLADEKVNYGGAEFARLIGRKAWQGYGRAGPKLEDMALVRAAYQTQYG
ncbi:phytanoyl-CoA dioxygenase family protein [Terricaulis sp.]|uniref:phytanoyl-CoA dioxygenase family protein n=1 Tax=Terricaulis sp. TaxID=2768686 RepID=UPI002AC66158|nr:phytanoyl-CoA dioxygenase family protein [Terricaulis sp.]MDZ4691724.1 phytanoyl-CoA dioxygenase family protein [Terricaulis sp.]